MLERSEIDKIKVREYRRGNKKKANSEKMTTQGTKNKEKKTTKTQHNMCWTPLYSNKHK